MSLGLEILNESIGNIKINEHILFSLKHIILSHKGYTKNNKHIEPQFPEAFFINLLSNLIRKMDLMHRDIKNDPNKHWTDKNNHFYRQLWKNNN